MSARRNPDREKARDLATRAYHAAAREDWPAANAAMAEAGQQSPNVIALVLTYFCDSAIGLQQAMGMPAVPAGGAMVRPAWINADTGQLTMNADELPPAVRWAGQLVAARAADDFDGFQALLTSMPADGHERGAYANALLIGVVSLAAIARERGGAA